MVSVQPVGGVGVVVVGGYTTIIHQSSGHPQHSRKMPIYQYECQSCKGEYEAYVHHIGEKAPCVNCGAKEVERIWKISPHTPASAFPYTTRHLDPSGKEIEVKSPKHLEQLCKQYGVTHRPDVGWLTKEYMGYDWKTKRQVYKESSGVGMKGCWV